MCTIHHAKHTFPNGKITAMYNLSHNARDLKLQLLYMYVQPPIYSYKKPDSIRARSEFITVDVLLDNLGIKVVEGIFMIATPYM